jgi:hypothetical protein
MSFGKRKAPGYGGVERRGGGRTPIDVEGEILIPGAPSIPCRIVDLSKTGARLAVASVFGIPQAFYLKARGGRYHCELIRKGKLTVAVKFME